MCNSASAEPALLLFLRCERTLYEARDSFTVFNNHITIPIGLNMQ